MARRRRAAAHRRGARPARPRARCYAEARGARPRRARRGPRRATSSSARSRSSTPTSSGSTTATSPTSRVDVERTFELLADVPAGKTVVSESGFHSREQLDELERVGVDAVLVGESLMRAPDPEAACRALTGGDFEADTTSDADARSWPLLLARSLGGAVGAGVVLAARRRRRRRRDAHRRPAGAARAARRDGDDGGADAGRDLRARRARRRVHHAPRSCSRRSRRSTSCPQQQRGESTGTGFVIDDDGNILTNAHVVENADARAASGSPTSKIVDGARSAGRDRSTDLALLKVDPEGPRAASR